MSEQTKQEETLDLTAFPAHDLGNALAVQALHGDKFLYTTTLGWLHHTGAYWQRVSEAIAANACAATLEKRGLQAYATRKKDIADKAYPSRDHIYSALTLFRNHVTLEGIDAFDSSKDEINFQDAAYDLRTDEMLPHTYTQRFTYVLPISRNKNADQTPWKNFVKSALGDEEVIRYVQKAVGYSLTGHTNEEKCFYCHGRTRAGKGTFLETLLALIPYPIGAQKGFSTFTAKRLEDTQNFDLASMRSSRLVFATESEQQGRLNVAMLKTMTGGDMITTAHKHRDEFTYRPQFKVWLVSNWPVRASADDDALWVRMRVIPFPNSFAGIEDDGLKDRLKTPEMLQGVAEWALEGARLWYKEGLGRVAPNAIVVASEKQRGQDDYVKQWVEDCCELNSEAFSSVSSLRESFMGWCDRNGYKYARVEGLSEILEVRFNCTPRQKRLKGKKARCMQGVHILGTDTLKEDKGEAESTPVRPPNQGTNGHIPDISLTQEMENATLEL